jgi:hypothetical protein
VKPFQLRSSLRHEEAVANFQRESSSLAEREKLSEFHALPVPKTTYRAETVSAPPAHALVVPLPMRLQSGLRAAKRADFNQEVGQNAAKLADMRNTLTKQKLQREGLEVQERRRKTIAEGGLMFQAKPISTADQYPTQAVPSTPLTTPFSPKLLTKARSCMKEARYPPSVPLAASTHSNSTVKHSSPRARSSFATPASAKAPVSVFSQAWRPAPAPAAPAVPAAAAPAPFAATGAGAAVPASASKMISPSNSSSSAKRLTRSSATPKGAVPGVEDAGEMQRDAALTQALQAL